MRIRRVRGTEKVCKSGALKGEWNCGDTKVGCGLSCELERTHQANKLDSYLMSVESVYFPRNCKINRYTERICIVSTHPGRNFRGISVCTANVLKSMESAHWISVRFALKKFTHNVSGSTDSGATKKAWRSLAFPIMGKSNHGLYYFYCNLHFPTMHHMIPYFHRLGPRYRWTALRRKFWRHSDSPYL